ncbi:MAG: hypothetical protein ACRDSG_19675 [Pseudonocardiaceae bacterium]
MSARLSCDRGQARGAAMECLAAAAPPDDRDTVLPDADQVQRVLTHALTSGLRDGDRD